MLKNWRLFMSAFKTSSNLKRHIRDAKKRADTEARKKMKVRKESAQSFKCYICDLKAASQTILRAHFQETGHGLNLCQSLFAFPRVIVEKVCDNMVFELPHDVFGRDKLNHYYNQTTNSKVVKECNIPLVQHARPHCTHHVDHI